MPTMEALIVALGKLLNLFVPVAVALGAETIRRKYKVDIDEANERRLQELARQGIAYAEEQARKAAKEQRGTPSAQKLEIAKDFVLKRAGEKPFRRLKKALPELDRVVEAELSRKRNLDTVPKPKDPG